MSNELEADPFETYDGTGADIAGWIYKKGGEQALRDAFNSMRGDGKREYFRDLVEELRMMGLTKPATIIAEITESFPSALDARFCPHKPGEPGYKIWFEIERRMVERYEKERPQRLKRLMSTHRENGGRSVSRSPFPYHHQSKA